MLLLWCIMLVTGTITVPDTSAQSCTICIFASSTIYNLIEYSDAYLKTSGSSWQYYRDEPAW